MTRLRTILCPILGFTVICIWSRAANASLLGYEPFDYAAGTVSAANGGMDWSGAHWSSSLTISSPGEVYSSLVTAGNELSAGNVPNRAFTKATSGSVWLSFIGMESGGSADQVDLLQGYSGGVWVGTHYSNVWQLSVGGTTVSTTADATTSSFLLARFDLNGTTATGYLWVNPDLSQGEPNIANADVTTAGAVAYLSLAKLELVGTGKTHILDEIRVGTTFADVTPTATPEPASLLLLGLGGVLVVGRKRRRVA